MSTTNIAQSELNQTPSNEATDKQEFLLKVPAEFAQFPLGFALDAGGSVTKIVYRSKVDYTAGQPNNGENILRIRFFPKGRVDELIEFLKNNCDTRLTSQDDVSRERPLCYQTGVCVLPFIEKLEEAFQCRIKVVSEAEALHDGVLRVRNLIPGLQQTVPYSNETTLAALSYSRELIKTMQRYKEVDSKGFGESPNPVNEAEILAYVTKIMTIDPSSLAVEINAKPINFPCVLIQCGSATAGAILHEDGKFEMGDFSPTAGKTLLGLGRFLAGAKNFQDLIEMASKGVRKNVDMFSDDVIVKNDKETNWYSLMPDNFPVFTLGKLAEEGYDGTYSKADIAAGLVYMHCRELAHFGVAVATRRKVTSVVYSGSFANWPLTQRILQECFLGETSLFPMIGEPQPSMHILSNSGFLTALGTWHMNVEELNKSQATVPT